jgi:uncharacterized protein (TIGR00251 family)
MICLLRNIRAFAALYRKGNSLMMAILVKPNSKANGIMEINDDFVRVAIKAPPIDGQANVALIDYLSGILGV